MFGGIFLPGDVHALTAVNAVLNPNAFKKSRRFILFFRDFPY